VGIIHFKGNLIFQKTFVGQKFRTQTRFILRKGRRFLTFPFKGVSKKGEEGRKALNLGVTGN